MNITNILPRISHTHTYTAIMAGGEVNTASYFTINISYTTNFATYITVGAEFNATTLELLKNIA